MTNPAILTLINEYKRFSQSTIELPVVKNSTNAIPDGYNLINNMSSTDGAWTTLGFDPKGLNLHMTTTGFSDLGYESTAVSYSIN